MDTATVARPVELIPVAAIRPAADNPRENVGDVSELAMSIKEVGVRQPILVIDRGDYFEIVAGERRHAAAQLAGLNEIPALVADNMDENERVLVMAIENLQREDLSPLEEARAYPRLLDTLACSQRDLSPRVGKTQSHISKRLALLKLPVDVQADVDSGGITIPDALELAKLADEPDRIKKVLKSEPWQSVATRVQHQLDEIKRENAIAELEESIESKGYRSIRVKSHWQLPKGTHRLKGGNHYDPQALDLTAAKHETFDCHAIAIDDRGDSFPVCTDRKNHPKAKTEQEKRAGTATGGGFNPPAEDKRSKQLRIAHEARRRIVDGLLGKKPPKGAVELMLRAFVQRELEYGDLELEGIVIALGLVERPAASDEDPQPELDPSIDTHALLDEFMEQGDTQLQRAAFAIAVDLFDGRYGIVDDFVRADGGRDLSLGRAYLEFLRTQGHELHELEQKALGTAASLPVAA